MGRGSASHLGHRGVGWFHGTVDFNAPPELEVNNSAHSITFRGSRAHASRAAVVALTFTFTGGGERAKERYGWFRWENHLLMGGSEFLSTVPGVITRRRGYISP